MNIFPYTHFDNSNYHLIKFSSNENYISHIFNDSDTSYESTFNMNNKNYLIYFNNIIKNIYIKIIISPRNVKHELHYWYTIERPFLKINFKEIDHLELLDTSEIDIIKFIINKTLKVCRDQNIIKFDTDKDIRREVSLAFNSSWYPFPG